MLVWTRCSALLILLFMIYWVFSDVEFSYAFMFNIPMFYLFYPGVIAEKKVMTLILPLIVNIVLWRPSYKSYIFIRSVFYAERYKTIVIMAISLFGCAGSILFYIKVLPTYLLSVVMSASYCYCLSRILEKIHSEGYNELFQIDSESKKSILSENIFSVPAIYVSVFLLLAVESSIQVVYPPAMAMVRTYQTENERMADVSPDGKRFLIVFDAKSLNGDVGIFDIETGEKIKSMGLKNVEFGMFTFDNKNIIVQKYNTPSKGVNKLEVYNIESRAVSKQLKDPEGLFQYATAMHFSSDGKYFATEGEGIAVWNYDTGKMIAYDNTRKSVKRLKWLSENSYVVIQDISSKNEESDHRVYWNMVSQEDNITRVEKKEITQALRKKTRGLKGFNLSIEKGGEDKVVMIIINGEPFDGIRYHKSIVTLWNVETEEEIFSIESNYRMLNAEFLPDKKNFMTCEELRNGRRRITFWNVETKQKGNVILVQKQGTAQDIRLIQDGKKAIELRNPMGVIDLK